MSDDSILPYDWTTEQAYAVVMFLEDLAEAIWSRYGFAIAKDYFPKPTYFPHNLQLDLPFPTWWQWPSQAPDSLDDDNDIPF
jgi:hypothetical protein